jgi:recombinational DNA repair protein (RecF pathway)
MPHRNLSYEAVVLRARESPGGDRIVTFLAADEGLVEAFAFGGPKSRLRSLASPYHAGTAWIYRDPVKNYQKLSDFAARQTFPFLRESLRRLWSASYFAEILLRTDAAGGESRAAYNLLLDGLSSLDAATNPRSFT